ncbi:Plasmodesmata-located protein 8 [Stylosanthes scabra]|uniref:Plasmodesmata-located protein 8 n=1 Tax=Stylosanthes scabra TaxID=79078 RepID=A0ABU6RF53_9FABA|nr:Plasmodesmata-located protein 8 [Stylosanthes scabra]
MESECENLILILDGAQASKTCDQGLVRMAKTGGDLDPIECSKCVQNSVNQIGLICPYSLGASLQLEGCYIRYEHVDFLGKLDTSLRYKKCNKNVVSNDVEFFRRRDDVLGDLQSRRNSDFRVSSSGLVQGYAQCLGDVSVEDCNSCMEEVVMKMKRFCGSAISGDVFLGQCYARYWESGHYNDEYQPDSSNGDQVGKSIAIIVGVVLGLAILVVLLSICKQAMLKRVH